MLNTKCENVRNKIFKLHKFYSQKIPNQATSNHISVFSFIGSA